MYSVLIVEDDQSIADLERDYLEINQYRVDVAYNSAQGLEKALNNDYDLLLLDVMLPEIDGFEICRQVRAQKEVPILMVSAKTDDIDKIRALGLGADDYITKPFSPNEFVARVAAHITRFNRLRSLSTLTQRSILTIGELKISLDDHRIFFAGTEVTMTNKEFELLVFLVQNPNRVYSKDELFDKVWGMDSFGDASTITVHIKRIRDKFANFENSPTQSIETVWGAGYRFKI